ncbi:Serine/threonine-protein kinase smu1 [Dissophora globulifera]|nr:Serine/threonine-protein kinase smu1 [Dissophora globulifera]
MSSSATNTMEIESSDVIRLIQQFLKENNLLNSLAAIQDETTVALNTVESVEAFTSEVLQGNWDNVLRAVSQLKIPEKKLMDLYEQIVIELVEMREIGTARTLLRQTTPTQLLRDQFPDRYLHLEHVLSRSHFDPKEAYPNGVSKEKRRQIIAQALSSEVTVVAPSRLVTLLGQALKFQEQQGMLPPDTAYDLFRGTVPVVHAEADDVPTRCYNTIKFPKKQHAESVAFSPNGQYLVTGSVDGFIEIWNYLTAKLRKDLKYQAEDHLMSMDDSAVLALAFSKDSEMLASGAQDGKIKVWKIQTGQCLRRYSPAHQGGVTSVCFSPDGTQVLSGSFDLTIRLHGLKSGKMLREFRGHTSFVNHASFSLDGTQVMSSSSDGTIKIWDYRTANCIRSFSPHDGTGTMAGASGLTVNSCIPFPKPNQVLVCMKSPTAYLLTMEGEPIRKFMSPDSQTEGAVKDLTAAAAARAAGTGDVKREGLGVPMTDFLALNVSPQSEIVYCLAENSRLHCYSSDTGKLIKSIPVAEGEVIGMAAHPFTNVLAINTVDGRVLLWKA